MNKFVYYVLALLLFFGPSTMLASIIVTNGLSHEFNVLEGVTYKGVIEIQNTASTTKNVRIYQQDYSYNSQGTSFYTDYGSNPRSNMPWVKVSSDLVAIGPQTTIQLAYEINVPSDIPAGSTWSTILVEPALEIEPEAIQGGIQVRSIMRYSIQIITNNSKNMGQNTLEFEGFSLQKDQENKDSILQVALANTGDVFDTVEVSVELIDNKTGESAGTFYGSKIGLLPDNSKSTSIVLSGVPASSYSAVVLASTDNQEIFGINIELDTANE